MLDSLPLGLARLRRPASVFGYMFERFTHGLQRQADGLPPFTQLSVVAIEAVAPGDVQVLAALETNYAAESLIKKEVKKRNHEFAERWDWDTEAGAVAVYADFEPDIRAAAEVVNDLLRLAAQRRSR